MDLSILIPARNEMFLSRTIEDILSNMEGDTEVIAVCDGNWPDPPIHDHPRVTLIYHPQSIGQRAATNEAARLSRAEFVMKCDGHCSFDKGFDTKLMADCEKDWTVIPRMYNLHVFDWKCGKCGATWYQGPTPTKCEKCDNRTEFERVMVWKPRENRKSDFMRFDRDLKFQYWGELGHRPESQGDIADTLSLIGACWMMHRQRYWYLDGMDEDHGSWGQMGTEIACKSWLSGGRLVVNKKTWFAHMFRTQGGDFGFPYPNPGVTKARHHSRELWLQDKWPKAIHPLSWLIEKFAPVPDWDMRPKTKEIIYYTDNHCNENILTACRKRLEKVGIPIVSVSQQSLDFGRNVVVDLPRGSVTMYKQIVKGLETSTADIVYLVEHDILYHPSHFTFIPYNENNIYYNMNRWSINAETGEAIFYHAWSNGCIVAYRKTLLKWLTDFLTYVEKVGYSHRDMGHAIGKRKYEGVQHFHVRTFKSDYPNLDICHGDNFSHRRYDFREVQRYSLPPEWVRGDEVPGWGLTRGKFAELIGREAEGEKK
jgi:hypothetical protein